MNIDERLEYISTLQQSHDEQIGRLDEQIGKLAAHMDVLTERTTQAMEAINRLARIADIHEDRISGLEDQQ